MKEYQGQIKAAHFKGVIFTAAPPLKERGMER